MADDLNDDDYYLQEDVQLKREEIPVVEKNTPAKKNKQKIRPKRSPGTYSDLISMVRIHYKKSKSEYELNELLSIFNSSISASSPSTSTISLDDYLNELIPKSKWSKQVDLPSAPVVLIIAQSALRCIELGKVLKNSSSKLFTFHYLFAKHKKLPEQIEHLKKPTTLFNIIIGTPKRIDDILDEKIVNFKRLKLVLIDWNAENIKQQRLVDLNQLKSELFHLLCEQKVLAKRFAKEKTQIALF